jgi:hypothetical protein
VEDFLVGNPAAGANTALTDSQGYAYFYDLGTALDGKLTVTAGQPDGAALERAYFTFAHVEAADLGIPLRLSSPPVDMVTFSDGTISDITLTTALNDAQGALVLPQMDMDKATMIDTEAVLGKYRCVTLPAGLGDIAIPENLYLATQPVNAPSVILQEAPWSLTFPQNHRLNALFGTIPSSQVTGACEMGSVLAAFNVAPYDTYYGEIGFVPSTATGSDQVGHDIVVTDDFDLGLLAGSVGRPPKTDFMVGMMADYTGADGDGTFYINSMTMVPFDDASPDLAAVPYATDSAGGALPTNPDPAVARYFPVAMALYFDPPTSRVLADRPPPTAERGVSVVMWRDDGTGSPVPLDGNMTWPVDSWLAIAKLKMDPDGNSVPNKHFVWDLVADNGTTPNLAVHEMHQTTWTYRDVPLACNNNEIDVVSRTEDLYWEIWRPYDALDAPCFDTTGNEVDPSVKECMDLPTLPGGWPRAGVSGVEKDDGFPSRQGTGLLCEGIKQECTEISGDSCVYIGQRCNTQIHKSCTQDITCHDCMNGDTCGYEERRCLTSDGVQYFYQRNTWHLRVGYLGMTGTFDFNNFTIDDRRSYLTHESTNRLEFDQEAAVP